MKTLQKNLPFELTSLYLLQHPEALQIERRLHQHFLSKLERGEWFRLSEEDVLNFPDTVIRLSLEEGSAKRLSRNDATNKTWKWSEESRRRKSEAMKGAGNNRHGQEGYWRGRTHSEATRRKMSDSHRQLTKSDFPTSF